MNGVLDLLIVTSITAVAVVFAFLSVAPRPWRARLLQGMAVAAEALSLRSAGQRLRQAANRHLQAAGCGGCGDCGTSGVSRGDDAGDIHVPLASVKRRR